MKTFAALALFHFIAFVHCKGVEKKTEFGVKGENDIHIYSEFFSVYKPTVARYEYVSFPPAGLVNYYNITYVRVNDYNPYLADVNIPKGAIGTGEITLSMKAPRLRRIEATVDIYGTWVGPCFKNVEDNNNAGNGDSHVDKDNTNNVDKDNTNNVDKDNINNNNDNANNNNEINTNDDNGKPIFDIDIRTGADATPAPAPALSPSPSPAPAPAPAQ